jgi:nicotinamide mononucleotide transporter
MLTVEICGTLIALGYVLLTIWEDSRCWYLAIVSAIIFSYIFFQAELYFESILQWIFVILSIRGLLLWGNGKNQEKLQSQKSLSPKWMSSKERIIHFIACIIGTFSLVAIASFTSLSLSLSPVIIYLDAFITAGSIVATIQATKKATESWLSWICVNCLASGLYIHKNLYITAFLYGVYTLLAVYGFNKWRQKQRL